MRYLIIDTNVPVMAAKSNFSEDIEKKCSEMCYEFISKLITGKSKAVVALDVNWEILSEYRKNINLNGDRTIATEYLLWILQNSQKMDWYPITKTGHNTFREFPTDPELKKFDPSDRKFVALSKAHPKHPPIYDGSDTDWWIHRNALFSNGINVVFLCEEYVRAKAETKA